MTVPKDIVKRKLPVRVSEHPAIFNQSLDGSPTVFRCRGVCRAGIRALAVTWSESISIGCGFPAGAEPDHPDVLQRLKAPTLGLE